MPDWDVVYAEKSILDATPADVLVLNQHLLSTKGLALDFASGLSGNGLYLAEKGYEVSAWDMSDVAVNKINQYAKNKSLSIYANVYDLEKNRPGIKKQFDLVVVSYFLNREGLRYLYDILKDGGLLFYQTFSGKQYKGQGPAREKFRLKKNELLDVFSDMQLLFYREDDVDLVKVDASQGQTYFVAKK